MVNDFDYRQQNFYKNSALIDAIYLLINYVLEMFNIYSYNDILKAVFTEIHCSPYQPALYHLKLQDDHVKHS